MNPENAEVENLQDSPVKNGGGKPTDVEIELEHKREEIKKEEIAMQERASGTFGLSVLQLEEWMCHYKERGVDYQDLKSIEDYGGIAGIWDKLKTSAETGIMSIEHRENDFGSNKVFVEPIPPFCSYIFEAFEDLMIRILIVAAIVQIFLGATLSDHPEIDWVDGVSIIVAIVVVVLVGSVTNWNKEKKFHEWNDLQNQGTKYKAIRNSQPIDLPSDDIVVGDVITIMVGDIMPADLLLLSGNGIKIDESSLTGESESLKKVPYEKCVELVNQKASKPPSPLILSGTNCIEGTGLALVLAVGDHSQKGIIKRTVDNAQENNKTPLEIKLEIIAERIGYFGMAAGAITLVALFIRFGVKYVKDRKEYQSTSKLHALVGSYLQNNPNEAIQPELISIATLDWTNPKNNISNDIWDIILLCVSIIVVAIPEGLPLAVTLSWAFSIKKLMDQNNLVRKMHACETMGGANYICTDKTGTWTRNEMNIFKVLTGNLEIVLKETIDDVNAGKIKDKSTTAQDTQQIQMRENPDVYFKNAQFWEYLKTAVALNLDGQIKTFDSPNENGDMETCETKNKTDKAFIDFVYRFKSPISEERKKYLFDAANFKQNPFDSKKKRMTTFVKHSSFPTGYRLYSKGGAENVKIICKYFINPETGEVTKLKDQQIIFICDKIEQFNKQMLRSLYICYKDITEEEYNNSDTPNESGLYIDQHDMVFISVVGIRDSLRNGVKEAVIKCKEASVTVIMVTGDNIVTATAIAKDCNILGDDVNWENMKPEDIEEEPELTNIPQKREAHITRIMQTLPKAITGNTFYAAIGGLICKVCQTDSNLCLCPKTTAEAEEIAKKTGEPQKDIKSDTIKDKPRFIAWTKKLRVMARSQPIHKYALVLGLKEWENVVSVTGDGTNDAPAWSKSDVGFAMFAGTDIAKEASDIVIIDNNFSSLVVAIIYGRNIYDNIRKFLQFQLTVNFCACLLVFICACIGNDTPLTPIQMLWVNLIMDSLGSLALATEPPYEALLKRQPTRRDDSIINGLMWKHIGIQSLVELGILLFLYWYAPNFVKEDDYVRLAENSIIKQCYGILPGGIKDIDHIIFGTTTEWKNSIKLQPGMNEYKCGKYAERQDLSVAFSAFNSANGSTSHWTIVFNVFVVYTWFNQINARVIDDSFNIFIRISKNFYFPIVTLCEFALQVFIIEFGNAAFKVCERGLSWYQWGICIGFSAVTFVWSVIIKCIPLEGFIDGWLNGINKSNEVANIDDWEEHQKETSGQRLVEKNNNENIYVNIFVKRDNEEQENYDKKIKSENSKNLRKNNSWSKKQGSLRARKPEINIQD